MFDKILTFPKFVKHLGVSITTTELEKEPDNNKSQQFLFMLLSSYIVKLGLESEYVDQ